MFSLIDIPNIKVNLQDIVLGYKATCKEYVWVNFILLTFAFTVYKGHLVSENRKETNIVIGNFSNMNSKGKHMQIIKFVELVL